MARTLVKMLIVLIILLSSRLLADARGVEHVLRIDDFEDGDLRAPTGLSWIPLTDDLVGGESMARLEIDKATAGSAGALKLTARWSGQKSSFVGVWLPLEKTGRPLDLAAFEGVRLRVKGDRSAEPTAGLNRDQGAGRIGDRSADRNPNQSPDRTSGQDAARSAGGSGASGPEKLLVGFRAANVNYMATVEAGDAWRVVEIPFATMEPQGKVPEGTRFSPKILQYFGVTTTRVPPNENIPASDVAFEIDDVELYGRAEESVEPAASGPPGVVSIMPFAPLSSIPSAGWVELATDPEGDASAALLPDVTRLEVRPDGEDGVIWFRMTLRETPHGRWMGVNLALDVDGDPNNGQPWWGTNKAFRFDRLLSVYCFPVAAGCQGTFGVVDAAQIASGTFAEGGEALRFAIDRERRAFVVGVPRASLHLGSGTNRLVAAVGSALFFGDDVPGEGAAVIR